MHACARGDKSSAVCFKVEEPLTVDESDDDLLDLANEYIQNNVNVDLPLRFNLAGSLFS